LLLIVYNIKKLSRGKPSWEWETQEIAKSHIYKVNRAKWEREIGKGNHGRKGHRKGKECRKEI
jgi:hypothetical protein